MSSIDTKKSLSDEERGKLVEQIRSAAQGAGLRALVSVDPANIAHATGLVFPYPEQYAEPRIGLVLPTNKIMDPVLICPPEWRQLASQQDWKGAQVICTVHQGKPLESLANALVLALRSAGFSLAQIGYEENDLPLPIYNNLKDALVGAEFIPSGNLWRELRMVKTSAEVRMLEEAARQGDRALVSALNHSEGCVQDSLSYSMWEFTERIRVHVGEFGGSATGHVVALQGEEMSLYTRPPRGVLKPGNPLRAEFTNHHHGYWSSSARTVHIGAASPEFTAAYRQNIELKRLVVSYLRPGSVCASIHQAASDHARAAGIPLCEEFAVGHGVGRSEREAPYLAPTDQTVLKPGMVLAVGAYTRGPQGEMICSKDTYVITETGSRLLSWYRDWDSRLYALVGITARHG